MGNDPIQGGGRGTYVALETSSTLGRWDRPPRREAQGDGAAVVLGGRESRPQGEGRQVSGNPDGEVREMRSAETVLGIIHDRDLPSWWALESRVLRNGACPVRGGAVGKVPVTATR
jgi:hypothetical protein